MPDRWLMNYSYGNNIIVGIEGGRGDEIKRAAKNGDVDFGFAQRRIKEKEHKTNVILHTSSRRVERRVDFRTKQSSTPRHPKIYLREKR